MDNLEVLRERLRVLQGARSNKLWGLLAEEIRRVQMSELQQTKGGSPEGREAHLRAYWVLDDVAKLPEVMCLELKTRIKREETKNAS